MAYATSQDIKSIYGDEAYARLTDADGSGIANETVAATALVFADAQINSYIGGRYVTPLKVVPDIIRLLTIDIAIYRMAQDHGRLTDEIGKRYDDAMKHLAAIAAGKAVLPVAPPAIGPVAVGNEAIVITDGRERLFTRDTMRGW